MKLQKFVGPLTHRMHSASEPGLNEIAYAWYQLGERLRCGTWSCDLPAEDLNPPTMV
jgi:hypothetical protein